MQQNKFLILIIAATLFCGCNKFLQKDQNTNRTYLSSPADVSKLITSAYPDNCYYNFCEAISDNAGQRSLLSGSTSNMAEVNQKLYLFTDPVSSSYDSPESYWGSCYEAIANANEALDYISKVSDPENYKAQKGEALVARAYAHFMLVNFYSKFYNEATAATDPGVPYVDQPENVVNKVYERKTVKYVYDMVEQDLLAGLPLIDDSKYSVPKYHFTKAAANAFACRFYLYKKNYNNVLKYANLVFNGANAGDLLRKINTVYNTLSYTESGIQYSKSSEPANILIRESVSLWNREYKTNSYGLNYNLLQITDTAKNIANTSATYAFKTFSSSSQDNYFYPKTYEYFYRTTLNAETGLPYIMVPLFTMEEVLFNRAEANAYLGNLSSVIDDINAYLQTRLTNYSTNVASYTVTQAKINTRFNVFTDDKANLIKAILNLRRKEFMQEGLRWFDILRYNLSVTHSYKGSNGNITTVTLSADDNRKVFLIPATAVSVGLAQNPR